MKNTMLFLALACGLSSVQAQQPVPKTDWQLNKVLWSNIHHDPLKGKALLDFDMIENWPSLGHAVTISADGKYVAYDIHRGETIHTRWGKLPVEVVVKSVDGKWKASLVPTIFHAVGFFSSDSKQYIFEDGKNGKDLTFLKLGTKERRTITDLASYKTPSGKKENDYNDTNKWIALSFNNKDLALQNMTNGDEKRYSNVGDYAFMSDQWFTCQTADASPERIFVNLKNDKEYRFAAPKSYMLTSDFQNMLVNQGDSLELINLATGNKTPVWSGTEGQTAEAPSFDSTEKQLIFTVKNANGGNSIWIWKNGASKQIANQGSVKAPAGFTLQSGAKFSSNGRYITYSLFKPAGKYVVPKGAVELTLWSSRDQLLQTTQMKSKDDSVTRGGILRAQDGKVLYVTKQDESAFPIGDCIQITRGKEDRQTDRFWDPGYRTKTITIQNIKTGAKSHLGTFDGYNATLSTSPNSNYAIYFDKKKGNFYCLNLNTLKTVNLCRGLKPGYFLACKMASPKLERSEGTYDRLGWLENNKGFLVQDDFDVWMLNPDGKAPVNLTNGYGRKHKINFQLEGYGWGGATVVTDKKFLMSAFNIRTKENGFYTMTLGVKKDPVKLTMGPQFMHVTTWWGHFDDRGMRPLKAQNANTWVVRKETPTTGANFYITHDLKNFKPVSSIVPHKNVNWYTRTLHRFKCLDGTEGEGILYKPENFNPKKKYPVLIPFYGQYACYMYSYQDPEFIHRPTTPCTNPAWMVNHGYLVFVPSIKVGKPVYSRTCFNVIEAAAIYLKKFPFVRQNGIGAATHSWSSKLGAYLFTHSKNVNAMAINEGYMFGNMMNTAFAPSDKNHESNMNSVENWEDDCFGEFWKNKESWIDQTTVLNLDKAQLPLLLSCGNGDLKSDTYPSQAFEIFNGLRRLNKPVWWFRYKNGGHNVDSPTEVRDNTIRFTQFFDHYLKGAPAPQWMTKGIPNKLVGVDPRMKLDPKGTCGPTCKICKKLHAK